MTNRKYAILLIFLILTTNTFAWKWETHEDIAKNIYENLPGDIQNNLNLRLMQEGSIAPDKIFRDYTNHHYPPSYKKADYWLNKTKELYANEDYDKASYALGVASHYISDSFSAPHYIKKEPPNSHEEYEKQGITKIKLMCSSSKLNTVSLENELKLAAEEKTTWQTWLKTRDERIPQDAVKSAAIASVQQGLTAFWLNASCSNQVAQLDSSLLLIVVSVILLVFVGVIFKRF